MDNEVTRFPLTELIVVDDIISAGSDLAQEVRDTLEAMREASGDPTDGQHLAVILERWEQLYGQYQRWLGEDA